jgi:dTDP-4-amino-4,6-dideoxygalactose transaminase
MASEPASFENRDLAFDAAGAANPWYYEMPEVGYNYRATDLQCALGMSQLGKLDRFAGSRRKLVEHYDKQLASLAPIVLPVARVADCEPAWHLYVVLIDFQAAGVDRAAIMRRLKADGIGTQVHYLPVHLQPYYRRRYGHGEFPDARRYYERALSLPLFPAMTDGDVDRVVDALRRALVPERGS